MMSDDSFNRIQIQNLQAICAASDQIRMLAERERKQVLEALEEMARLFMPEALLAEGQNSKDKLTPEHLLKLARRRAAWARLATNGEAVAQLQARADALQRDLAEVRQAKVMLKQQLETARRANEEQATQLQAAHSTIQGLQETISGLQETVAQLQSQLNAPQAKPGQQEQPASDRPVVPSTAAVKPPLTAINPETAALLRAIGETGLFLRTDLAQHAALGKIRGGKFRGAIRRLLNWGWIEELQPASEAPGRAPRIARLSARRACTLKLVSGVMARRARCSAASVMASSSCGTASAGAK
ncbi:MAG: hypothetical protein U9R05_04070 [Chloroflexota bacterium]|nr:hypothetical protein [Chloroflexota bacterium]